MSFLTGEKARDPRTSAFKNQNQETQRTALTLSYCHGHIVPNMPVRDSEASRNSVVEMALFFSASTGTSVNDCLKVSRTVPPGGSAAMFASFGMCCFLCSFGQTGCPSYSYRVNRRQLGAVNRQQRGVSAAPLPSRPSQLPLNSHPSVLVTCILFYALQGISLTSTNQSK